MAHLEIIPQLLEITSLLLSLQDFEIIILNVFFSQKQRDLFPKTSIILNTKTNLDVVVENTTATRETTIAHKAILAALHTLYDTNNSYLQKRTVISRKYKS